MVKPKKQTIAGKLSKKEKVPEKPVRWKSNQKTKQDYPSPDQGFCVWFTGLSGSGKSTTGEALASLLHKRGRKVTFLDGDIVRTHLSKGLGFSREDRDTNILRIGFVAAEIVRHGGAVITAAISPFRATRDQVRKMVGKDHFIEVYVNTPISICEQRDVKGLYARARIGEVTGFTGIDDPYEAPLNPEIVLETVRESVQSNSKKIINYLENQGYLQKE